MSRIKFFKTQAQFRKWLKENHNQSLDQWVGFYKIDSGKPSIAYQEALDEALCFGWIDGIRKRVDEVSYMIRFTPRRPGSIWSRVNIRRAKELKKLGFMHPSGLREFDERDRTKTHRNSFERENRQFDNALQKKFKSNSEAWRFFQEQPEGYKKLMSGWVVSAKKEETRVKRLSILMRASLKALRVDLMNPSRTK